MAYTRTQLYKQINFGTAFIRPLFFEFDNIIDREAVTSSSYMYGPSILAFKDQVYSNKYFPTNNGSWWCAMANDLSEGEPICFN